LLLARGSIEEDIDLLPEREPVRLFIIVHLRRWWIPMISPAQNDYKRACWSFMQVLAAFATSLPF